MRMIKTDYNLSAYLAKPQQQTKTKPRFSRPTAYAQLFNRIKSD